MKLFDFECNECGHVFEELVKDGEIPECPSCGNPNHLGCSKLISKPAIPTNIVVMYPGSKRFKAGYVHSHGDRPAEKKGSQVSMHGAKK